MYCYKCGAKLENGARFCSSCGARVISGNGTPGSGGQVQTEKQTVINGSAGFSGLSGAADAGGNYGAENVSTGANRDFSTETQKNGTKKNTILLVVLLIVLAVVVGILIAVFLNPDKGTVSEPGVDNGGEEPPLQTEVINPDSQLNMNVQQIDASEYPIIRVYMDISDSISAIVPTDLEKRYFTVKKKNSDGTYTAQSITVATQLDETENLNVNIIADVSGSMDGEPLYQAKAAMTNFVNTMQFGAGDKVELISFSTGVYLQQEFCGDKNLLISDINSFYTDDMTSLYDALYTGVLRTAAQPGAKCVIAFTDGEDNYSSCTEADVINVAQRYGIPVFIIGFGSVNTTSMNNIASQTGGKYYGINEVSSMEDIYRQIYRQEKEMYLIEFTAQGSSISESMEIIVEYLSKAYGGKCTYQFTPKILNSVSGAMIYSSGPEAVVEGYIQNLDDAMNARSVSPIASYMKPGSSIYTTQDSYVKKGIDEQLDSYEIVSVDYSSNDRCVVTTRETFYVQKTNQPLELLTQQCRYVVESSGGKWQMTAFAENVKVLSKIKV